jgi:hypothetical protein
MGGFVNSYALFMRQLHACEILSRPLCIIILLSLYSPFLVPFPFLHYYFYSVKQGVPIGRLRWYEWTVQTLISIIRENFLGSSITGLKVTWQRPLFSVSGWIHSQGPVPYQGSRPVHCLSSVHCITLTVLWLMYTERLILKTNNSVSLLH